jgi:hypothetical protein
VLAGLLALAVASGFAGTAICVSIAEQRVRLEDGPLLAQWRPSCARGALYAQALLAGPHTRALIDP